MTVSFSSLYYFGHWLSQSLSFLWNNHAAHSETTVARMLVGNKSDLENIRDVSVEEGKSLAEAEGLFFIETSALDSTNVKKAFEIVIREIYNNISRKVLNSDSYKAELSVNRVSLVSNGADGAKQANSRYSCCSWWVNRSKQAQSKYCCSKWVLFHQLYNLIRVRAFKPFIKKGLSQHSSPKRGFPRFIKDGFHKVYLICCDIKFFLSAFKLLNKTKFSVRNQIFVLWNAINLFGMKWYSESCDRDFCLWNYQAWWSLYFFERLHWVGPISGEYLVDIILHSQETLSLIAYYAPFSFNRTTVVESSCQTFSYIQLILI